MRQRRIVAAAAAMVVALMAGSCLEPMSERCVSGDVCPDGYKCTASGDACIERRATCGDGFKDPDELCDDGNADNTDRCIACQSNGDCGNGILEESRGEKCDNGPFNGVDNPDGGENCSADCRSRLGCGNGLVDTDAGEQCDTGGIDSRSCTQFCKVSYCGDGYVNGDAGEICDDESVFWRECPYGMGSCQACDTRACSKREPLTGPDCGDRNMDMLPDGGMEACDDGNKTDESTCGVYEGNCPYCNSTCTAEFTIDGPFCGNDSVDVLRDGGLEACDDGNTDDETSCAYGEPTCRLCNATCTVPLDLTGKYCGDGTKNGPETCDDANADPCGTCSANCAQDQDAKATGSIAAVPAANLKDTGDTFTLNDGTHPSTVFEFLKMGNESPGNIPIRVLSTDGVQEVASAILDAITLAPNLDITPSVAAGVVLLVNDHKGSAGNQPILEFVVDTAFVVTGMDGGAGHDCDTGIRCTGNDDCASGNCTGSPKTCQ